MPHYLKPRGTKLFLSVCAIACSLIALRLFADLTVRVDPGYTFATGERPTVSTLNRLGNPTITISGTVSGTNVALAFGSVTKDHLNDNVVGSNITFDAGHRLVISNSGVNVSQLSTNIAGAGLTGGAGTRIYVTNLAANQLTVTSNYIIVGTSGNVGTLVLLGSSLAVTGGVLNVSSSFYGFTTAEYSFTSGTAIETNHGLSITPSLVRWVIVCKTNDSGWVVGDELDVAGLEGDSNRQFVQTGASSSNIFANVYGEDTSLFIKNKTNGVRAVTVNARWKLKGYAKP